MKKSVVIAGVVLGSFFALPAISQNIHKKESNQEARIARGVAQGELTKRETRTLVAQQNQIDRMQARAKADGVVTKRERRAIRKEQKQADRAIRRQKNDLQKRY